MRGLRQRAGYERDPETWPAGAYRSKQHPGIALRILGWETQPDEDTEWSGYESRTGKVLAIMVGDDYKWKLDPDDILPLAREDYCGECGQIGCHHDGLAREGE